MPNEVRIKLTDSQRSKIKKATGKDMTELRVSSVGSNPAVTGSKKSISARTARTARNLSSASARTARVGLSSESARTARAALASESARTARTVTSESARTMRLGGENDA